MFAAIGIDEQGGVQSDVFTFFASAQDRELAVDNFLPYQTGVLAIIHADRHNPRIQ